MKRSIQFFILSALLATTYAPIDVRAIGVSPAQLVFPAIHPQESAPARLMVSRADTAASTTYDIEITGSGAKAIHSNESTLTFAVGEQEKTIPFTIDTSTLPLGDYEALVIFSAHDANSVSSDSHVLDGAAARVQFSVSTNDITQASYSFSGFVVDKNSVSLQYAIENTGNVPFTPKDIEIRTANSLSEERTFSISANELSATPAFSTMNHTVSLGEFDQDFYEVDIVVHNADGSVLAHIDNTHVQIEQPLPFSLATFLRSLRLRHIPLPPYLIQILFGIGSLLLIGWSVLHTHKKAHRKKKRTTKKETGK